ncbi:diguanylate cyclase [Psychrobacillus sp. L4]|uniref:sensor domain-containing diguanylate cyclase n=1 Tax=Psychrobacillus sp. L4 TaxID=3236892 RepID=UPI0036F3E419
MPIGQLSIYLCTYILPTLYLFGMACVVISQHPKRLENRLVASIVFLYSLLFFEEFFRHLLPIELSAIMSKLFFGNLGLLIVGITFHLYMHVALLHKRGGKSIYPFLFYVPFFVVIAFLLFDHNLISNTQYHVEGIWYAPVFNAQYYTTMTVSNIFIVFMLLIIVVGYRKVQFVQHKKTLRFFMLCTCVILALNIALGYPNYGEVLPPYPYLYEGLIFSVFLTISVLRFNLLPNVSRRYETLFDLSPNSIMAVNSKWDILEVNEHAKQMLRINDKSTTNMMSFVQTKNNQKLLRKLAFVLQENEVIHDYRMSFEPLHKDGIIHLSIDASIVFTGEDKIYYLMWRDVTDDVEKEKIIMHMAYYDVLTNLNNRAFFVTKVSKRLVELSNSPNNSAVLVLLDLNHFKEVNDKFGHSIGDQVLQHTADILKQAVRKNDLVARFGGDEFVLFLQEFPSRESFFEWVLRLRSLFAANRFETKDIVVQIEPSIGMAFYPDQALTFEDLFHEADLDMYEDKKSLKSMK